MTREDIIRMAREADLIYWQPNSTYSDGVWWMDAGEPGDELERFAALIASRVAAASASVEREACAKVCEELVPNSSRQSYAAGVWDVATFDCAAAIRARGQHENS